MAEEGIVNSRQCFVATPVGSEQSDVRRAAEGVIDSVIVPELLKIGFAEENIIIPHRIDMGGSITNQIIAYLIKSDLVIANLTGLNPNVMYELAIRHSFQKPVVQICEKNTKLPFDVADQRTVFYVNDMYGVPLLQDSLAKAIQSALSPDSKINSPVFEAIKLQSILESNDSIPVSDIVPMLEHLVSKVGKLESAVNATSMDNDRKRFLRDRSDKGVGLDLNTETENSEVVKRKLIRKRQILDEF